MSDNALEPIDLLRRAEAVRKGFTDGELARLVRRGELVRLQRGAYLVHEGLDETAQEKRRRALITATVAGLRVPGVISHLSAAVVHDLPLWGVPMGKVHVTRHPTAAGSGSSRVRLHVARLHEEQVVEVGGLTVTDVTRTVVDLARSLPFEAAVVTADAALARRATSPAELSECLAAMGPVPGSRRATRVLAFANGLSGSVGESRSRVALHRLGLPVPDLQVRVRHPDGAFIGQCDFGWRKRGTLGEFDGKIKYGRLLRPGQTAGDAVYEEKLREDALRDTGWQVVRWTWSELNTPRLIGERLRRAFARGTRTR